jgi:hypothetical protein
MKMLRLLGLLAIMALIGAPTTQAQEQPKPGPEHAILKKQEGTWEATIKGGGTGTMVMKMDLGGLWMTSSFEGSFGDMKFTGKGLDTYDSAKKKYVGVWVDSMSTSLLTLEGAYDKETKTTTMTGEGPGPDGKPTKMKTVTQMKDDDNMVFTMFMGDAKDPMVEITYKRKK